MITRIAALALAALPAVAAGQAPGSTAPAQPAAAAPDPRLLAAARALNPFTDRVLLGPGVVVTPDYPGADGFRLLPIPAADVRLGRFYFNGRDGAGFDLLGPRRDGVRIGLGAFFRPDRVRRFDPVRLRGLDDIDLAPQIRAFVRKSSLRYDLGVMAQRDLGGTDGLTVDLSASRRWLVGGGALSVGPTLSFADGRFMRGFFGVSPAEAARGARAAYDPDAGLYEVSVGGAFVRPLGRRWALSVAAGLGHLVGDAADSPVVARELAPRGALGVAYRFK